MRRKTNHLTTVCIASVLFIACGLGEKPAAPPQKVSQDTEPQQSSVSAGKVTDKIQWVFSAPAGVYFSKSEITAALYVICQDEGGCTREPPKAVAADPACNIGKAEKRDHPANCVSWRDADAFCRYAGGRLPTMKEWMAELNAGGDVPKPWNSAQKITCDDLVWAGMHRNGCGKDGTWPVCSKPAGNSASGICDMSGNVWEWMDVTPEVLKASDDTRFLKGGSWRETSPNHFSTAFTRVGKAYEWDASFGFHCVREK